MIQAPPGFRTFGRAAWAPLGRGRAPAGATPPADTPVTEAEWREVYVPLAHILGMHVDAAVDLRRRIEASGLRGVGSGPFVIGLAGSVAGGKSTCAAALAALLRVRTRVVEVVSTDGFLHTNAVLAPLGLVARKGYPETYDRAAIESVLGALAAGAPSVSVPSYSHVVYDIAGPPQVLERPDIVIIEGVNALAEPITDFCAFRIYLDAEEPALREWYVARFLGLIDAARTDPASFFAQWTGLGPAEARALAEGVWQHVNLPNLNEHLLPTRWRSDVVLHKANDHCVEAVSVRHR